MAKPCPSCGLVHPDSAVTCECGRPFVEGAEPIQVPPPPWHRRRGTVLLLVAFVLLLRLYYQAVARYFDGGG